MSTLAELDQKLAEKYGAYASYANALDPIFVETYGDSPSAEVDRLLAVLTTPESHVLDIGCGAGFTLCQLAPKIAAIWGIEDEADLLAAAQLRVASRKLTNVIVLHGNVERPEDVAQLPDNTFDLVLSRRGPNVTPELLSKLKSDAHIVQELFQNPLGLLEIFGRKTFLADLGDNPSWLVDVYSWLDLFPVSIKDYYYDFFFRDIDHLAAYLSQQMMLLSWPMPPMPYRGLQDRTALELYARYNATPKGIRIVNHRKVCLFRRTRVQFAPSAPEIQPYS